MEIKGLVAAPGSVFVLPESNSNMIGDIEIATTEKELPIGTVCAVGKIPREFRHLKIKVGDKVVYSRASNAEITMVSDTGSVNKVKVLFVSDIRGVLEDEKQPKKISGFWIALLVAGGILGALFGKSIARIGAAWAFSGRGGSSPD